VSGGVQGVVTFSLANPAGRRVLSRRMSDARIREATIASIQEAVARHFGLPVDKLNQESTRRETVIPRQIAMYVVKQMTDASLPEIGRHFGGRHHTTVMHSIAKVHNSRNTDAALDHVVRKLLTNLGHR
jgi:chromosomal replication initiator protein